MISPVLQVVSYADVNDLFIGTGSNALMTLDLDDSDYLMMSPRSSIVSVSNTVNYADSNVLIRSKRGNSDITHVLSVNSSGEFSYIIPSNYTVNRFDLQLKKGSLPSPGTYRMQFDYSSDFANEISSISIASRRDNSNATSEWDYASVDNFTQNSGDIYFDRIIELGSGLNYIEVRIVLKNTYSAGAGLGGKFSINFSKSSATPDIITPGVGQGSVDYENDVSSSLSDLSSSVDTMTDEISGVTEAIQNLQGAMEPHYSNVLTQLHHITEQLHAFYDQIYNNIHLKEYALWQDIKTAIENIDLEVNVNLDKLKTSIDNMSTAIQNKLQSVQEAITNGFDNQGINQDAAELDQSLQEYEEAEQTVLDQVNDSLNDFEFDSGFDEYKTTISVFSDFLQDLYDSSGGFKVVINLSLMLSIAGIVIGVYRFRDGG